MHYRCSPWLIHALAIVVSVWQPSAIAASELLHGAGATFPAPVYVAWSRAYQQTSGVQIDYDAVGSGAGIEQIRQRQIDFGASDAALAPEQLAADKLLQFPVVIGGVVPVINITGIKPGQLKLSAAVLADIYLGHIRKWNAAAIADLNPTLKLPHANITVVHRSDASGSSLLWTDYLAHASATWRTTVGSSLAPQWPTGIGGSGNEGVASYVQRTRFAIGYVEYAFAQQHRLSDVALRNRSGRFVQAGRDTFLAAVQAMNLQDTHAMQQLPTDLPGALSWPITGLSFILIDATPVHGAKTRAVLQFFDWALHHGQAIARDLNYEPLPPGIVEQLPALWQSLRDSNGTALWP